jgi:hypothetical protein
MPRPLKGSKEAIEKMNKVRGVVLVKGSDECKKHMQEMRDKIKRNKDTNKTN